MWYTYNLLSLKNFRIYTGSTSDLKQRFADHNKGIGGKYTADNRPFKLIHYEAFLTKIEALEQERFYKTGYGREVLMSKLHETLKYLRANKK
ncbi:GIY-YIG nuclease family protein [Candidatus Kuenenbacteria bacterium]|nr:GIY-YIG nuclease family protein [Candidatus Kuenenbacteria bacterium]